MPKNLNKNHGIKFYIQNSINLAHQIDGRKISDIASELNIDKAAFSRICVGKTLPSFETAIKLAFWIKKCCDTDFFFKNILNSDSIRKEVGLGDRYKIEGQKKIDETQNE